MPRWICPVCRREYGDTRRFEEHFKLRKNTQCLRWQRRGLSDTVRRQNNDLNPSIGGRPRLYSAGSISESASAVAESVIDVAESILGDADYCWLSTKDIQVHKGY